MLNAYTMYRLRSFRRVFFSYHQYRIEQIHYLFDSLSSALIYVAAELDDDVTWCVTRYVDDQIIARSAY